MKYLDTFTRVQDALIEERGSLESIQEQRTKIVDAENKVNAIPETLRALTVVQQQLKAFEAANGAEVIKLQRSLATDKTKRENLTSFLEQLRLLTVEQSLSDTTAELRSIADAEDIVTGATEATEITAAIDEFSGKLIDAQREISVAFAKLQAVMKASIGRWAAADQ
jgi:hypothetical protein